MSSILKRKLTRSLSLVVLVAASCIALVSHGTPVGATTGESVYVNAQGFDTCMHLSGAQYDDLWNGSPLYMYGAYIGYGSGGIQVGCTGNSTATFLHSINIGFGIIPFYFGLQMGGACNMGGFTHTISLNTATAYSQGVNEANSAAGTANALGLF